MPAARHLLASSSNAFAVIAMIGIVFASALSMARMAFVAAIPSITGIMTSINMASKVPGGLFSKCSTACLPFFATVTFAPSSVSSISMISALSSLSSAASRCNPRISYFSAISLSFFCSRAISNGIVMTNTDPTPT